MTLTPSSSRSAGVGAGSILDYEEIAASVPVTSNSEAAPNNVIAVPARTYDGSTAVWIEFRASEVTPAAVAGAWVILTLWDAAVDLGRLAMIRTPAASNMDWAGVVRVKLTPSAGSHTYSVKAWQIGGNGVVSAASGGAGAVFPASLCVSRAS